MQLYRSLITAPKWPCDQIARSLLAPDVLMATLNVRERERSYLRLCTKYFGGFTLDPLNNISPLQIHLCTSSNYIPAKLIIHRSPALASSASHSNPYAEATQAHLDYFLRSLHTLSPTLKDCFLDRITSRKKQRRRWAMAFTSDSTVIRDAMIPSMSHDLTLYSLW